MNRYLILPTSVKENPSDLPIIEPLKHLQEYKIQQKEYVSFHFRFNGKIYGLLLPRDSDYFDYATVADHIRRFHFSPLELSGGNVNLSGVVRVV